MMYIKGRNNLSATVFVPWDCDNNCPFCTSKMDYKRISCDFDSVLQTVDSIGKSDFFGEWVLTGGEPFADPAGLQLLMDRLSKYGKPIYINTTLPMKTFEEAVELINQTGLVQGINVSRHIGVEFPNVASVSELNWIKKPVRINTVVGERFTFEKFLDFVAQYGKKKRDINLRADYRTITENTLKSRDIIFSQLASRYEYVATESCMVCNTDYFSVDDTFLVSYHRGLERSSAQFGEKTYVNDIIVKQNGEIFKDWNCIADEKFFDFIKRRVSFDG